MANNQIFTQIEVNKPQTSTFDLSHDHKLTLEMGKLIPFNCIEMVAGDKIQIKNEALLRFMPMIAPVMHKIDVYIHHFFVPNRILWKNFEDYLTNDDDEDAPAFPTISSATEPLSVNPSSLADYLGLPLGTIKEPISALPFAAYKKIYLDYFADQNLFPMEELEEAIRLDDGLQSVEKRIALTGVPFRRAWEHDYFTSALPFAQKGNPVTIPVALGGSAVVKDTDIYPQSPQWVKAVDGNPFNPARTDFQVTPARQFLAGMPTDPDGPQNIKYNPNGHLIVDGEDFGSLDGTINDLRTAYTLQKFLELNARGGTRFIELLKVHFNVTSSDKRLQRAEYIGGSKNPVVISEVLQTSETNETPQGTMGGHGISAGSGKHSSYYCEEHGYFISLISVMPQTAYFQGIPKHFQKFDKYDHLWPLFAKLGEQPIYGRELYYDPADPEGNAKVFGYIPRYSEYRYHPSRVSGEMQTSLKFWHMAREFSSRPNLNNTFVASDPTKRIFAVESATQDSLVAHIFSKIRMNRRLPFYGTPGGL